MFRCIARCRSANVTVSSFQTFRMLNWPDQNKRAGYLLHKRTCYDNQYHKVWYVTLHTNLKFLRKFSGNCLIF